MDTTPCRSTLHRPRYSSQRDNEFKTLRMERAYYHHRWGVIYPECINHQWYAVGANTWAPAMNELHADLMCRRWADSGDCPVPKGQRITPRTRTRSA